MAQTPDPYLWLEDVGGERALAWVRERNAESQKVLEAEPGFGAMRQSILDVLDSREQIPYVSRQGNGYYNFWRDAQNPRGLWRRTTLASYRTAQPAWETVIDVDALGKAEGQNWVWGGATCIGPEYRRCLVRLSRGGADAKVVREFDTVDKTFVAGGFTVPEAKTSLDWIDIDTLYVGTDFGPGSMTESGYPRQVKRWKRGQPLASAELVFEGEPKDVAVGAWVDRTPGYERSGFYRAVDFYNTKEWLLRDGKPVLIDKPSDAKLSFWRDDVLIELRSDWTVGGKTFPKGSLLAGNATAYLNGERKFEPLFTPTATRSLAGFSTTQGKVLVSVLDNVASRLEEWTPTATG